LIIKPDEVIKLRRKLEFDKYFDIVKEIIEKVKNYGDKALIEFTEKFDGVKINKIKVEDEEIDKAYEKVDDETIDSLESARENIERFHTVTLVERDMKIDFGEAILGKKYVPYDIVGLYIPGGRASYPSTALMAGVAAKVAGVKEIVACTPPDKNGKVKPLTLVACDIAGINEIYSVGGAQAIAAMAYGTESVKKVDKIAGPGNIYVTVAKILVQKDVPIDMPAGPSEIMIIADENANARFIALDAIAQLEHDPMSIAVVLTTSINLAEKIESEVSKLIGKKENFVISVVNDIEEAIKIANEFAPEHLSLFLSEPEKYLDSIKNAGSVFLGEYSPVAAGDYAVGTNHILPTMGYAKYYSGLSAETFLKSYTYQKLTKDGLKRIKDIIIRLALAEGLPYHAKSVEERFK